MNGVGGDKNVHNQQQNQSQSSNGAAVSYSSYHGGVQCNGMATCLSSPHPPTQPQSETRDKGQMGIGMGNQQHICAFATLPRNPRQSHFFSAIGGGGQSGSPYNNGGSSTSNCNGPTHPQAMNNINNASVNNAIQFRDLPQTIHENETECVLTYHNLQNLGGTLSRPFNKGNSGAATQYSSHSPQASPQSSVGGGGGRGSGLIKYDNIGRRITASGNSAIKVPGTEDDVDGESLQPPPPPVCSVSHANVNGNSGNPNSSRECDQRTMGMRQKNGCGAQLNNRTITSQRRRFSLDNVPL